MTTACTIKIQLYCNVLYHMQLYYNVLYRHSVVL